jgi:hypothetical protein
MLFGSLEGETANLPGELANLPDKAHLHPAWLGGNRCVPPRASIDCLPVDTRLRAPSHAASRWDLDDESHVD